MSVALPDDPYSIANHVQKCLQGFHDACSKLAEAGPRIRSKIPPGVMHDSFGRFRLWVGNIGAHRRGKASLDYKLREASHIRIRVSELLQNLESVLLEAQEIVTGQRVPWEDLSDSDSDASEGESECPVNELPTELAQLVSNMAEINGCLMRLSLAIRNPAPHDQFKESTQIDVAHFEVFDIDHVRGKFPQAADFLVLRLGTAISRRRQYLRYREDHRKKLEQGLKPLQEPAAPSQAAHTVTAPSEKIESTVASSLPLAIKASASMTDLDEDDYYEDTLSQTSYASSHSDPARLRPPPLPEAGQDGEPFECPLCFRFTSVRQATAWHKHVYRDLQPYVCTFDDCKMPDRTYESRHEWFQHELQAHRKWWECIEGCNGIFRSLHAFHEHLAKEHEILVDNDRTVDLVRSCERQESMNAEADCGLCDLKLATLTQLRRHLGKHYEELSLFALPSHMKDDDDEHDQGDVENDSVSSVAGSGNSLSLDQVTCGQCGLRFDDDYEDRPAALIAHMETAHGHQKTTISSVMEASPRYVRARQLLNQQPSVIQALDQQMFDETFIHHDILKELPVHVNTWMQMKTWAYETLSNFDHEQILVLQVIQLQNALASQAAHDFYERLLEFYPEEVREHNSKKHFEIGYGSFTLYQLVKAICIQGGSQMLVHRQDWSDVALELDFGPNGAIEFVDAIKNVYKRYLAPFEEQLRANDGKDPLRNEYYDHEVAKNDITSSTTPENLVGASPARASSFAFGEPHSKSSLDVLEPVGDMNEESHSNVHPMDGDLGDASEGDDISDFDSDTFNKMWREYDPLIDEEQKTWQCTFCYQHLAPKSWRRHEMSSHHPKGRWTCLASGPRIYTQADGSSMCVFCQLQNPSEEHFLQSHRIQDCLSRSEDDRTYDRPAELRRHVRQFHRVHLLDTVKDQWRKSARQTSWTCGFCNERLATWKIRETHIANHFKDGLTMSSWQNFPPLEDTTASEQVPASLSESISPPTSIQDTMTAGSPTTAGMSNRQTPGLPGRSVATGYIFQCDAPGCSVTFSRWVEFARHGDVYHGGSSVLWLSIKDTMTADALKGVSNSQATGPPVKVSRYGSSMPTRYIFQCDAPGCSVTFSRWSDFVRHDKAHRGGGLAFWCPVAGCNRSEMAGDRPFPRMDKMKEHIRRVHGEEMLLSNLLSEEIKAQFDGVPNLSPETWATVDISFSAMFFWKLAEDGLTKTRWQIAWEFLHEFSLHDNHIHMKSLLYSSHFNQSELKDFTMSLRDKEEASSIFAKLTRAVGHYKARPEDAQPIPEQASDGVDQLLQGEHGSSFQDLYHHRSAHMLVNREYALTRPWVDANETLGLRAAKGDLMVSSGSIETQQRIDRLQSLIADADPDDINIVDWKLERGRLEAQLVENLNLSKTADASVPRYKSRVYGTSDYTSSAESSVNGTEYPVTHQDLQGLEITRATDHVVDVEVVHPDNSEDARSEKLSSSKANREEADGRQKELESMSELSDGPDNDYLSEENRSSQDCQFTTASPDEEMHGKAVALFDFARENDNELSLVQGQVILVSYRHSQGWLVAQDPKTDEIGLVPEEYVQLLRNNGGGWDEISRTVVQKSASAHRGEVYERLDELKLGKGPSLVGRHAKTRKDILQREAQGHSGLSVQSGMHQFVDTGIPEPGVYTGKESEYDNQFGSADNEEHPRQQSHGNFVDVEDVTADDWSTDSNESPRLQQDKQPLIRIPTPQLEPEQSARATRRLMLTQEFTSSLRQNPLWEQQQNNTTTNAVAKRRQSANPDISGSSNLNYLDSPSIRLNSECSFDDYPSADEGTLEIAQEQSPPGTSPFPANPTSSGLPNLDSLDCFPSPGVGAQDDVADGPGFGDGVHDWSDGNGN